MVGAGPAGAILSLLLARRGVPTVLLEAQHDFDRDFRGDTVHPSTLEMLDGIGLADGLLESDHIKGHEFALNAEGRRIVIADFRRLGTRFPYIAFLPQVEFLNYVVAEARTRVLRAAARRPGQGADSRGGRGAWRALRGRRREPRLHANLTVAADGRASRLRKLAGIEPMRTAPPMDVMWFILPRKPEDRDDEIIGLYVGRGGRFVVVFGRPDGWQVGYVVLKGSARDLREAGLDALRESLATTVPALADRAAALSEWTQCHFLNVESSRVPRWHQPGLLLVGDAAHVMSPVGGVGINYAVQDAVRNREPAHRFTCSAARCRKLSWRR